MRRLTAYCLSGAALVALFVGAASSSCKGSDEQTSGADGGASANDCQGPGPNAPASALAIEPGVKQNGTLCPGAGPNWYVLTVPAGDDLLDINVAYPGELTTVTPYARLYNADGSTPTANGEADGNAKVMSGAVNTTLKLPAAGMYYLQIGDLFDKGDANNTYTVQVASAADPDTYEPNDVVSMAKEPGTNPGWLAYRQDIDVFHHSLGDGGAGASLLHMTLTNPTAALSPISYTVSNSAGTVVSSGSAPQADAPLDGFYSLGTDSAAYVSLSYPTTAQPDRRAEVGYHVTLESVPDPDSHEPNNSGAQATYPCAAAGGGTQCSSASFQGSPVDFAADGFISYVSDLDYYRVDVAGTSTAAVLQVTLTAGSTPIDYAVDIIVPDSASSCKTNDDCLALNHACTSATALTDCAISHACAAASSGPFCSDAGACSLCAGSGSCVPSGAGGALVCGGTQYSFSDLDGGMTLDATGKNVVQSAQPLLQEGPYYVVVRDLKGQNFDLTGYHLDIQVVSEPDPNDQSLTATSRNNFYDAYQLNADAEATLSAQHATSVALADSGTTSISGYISYQTDEDWYVINNPCHNQYCQVVFDWSESSSTVDPSFFVYAGDTDGGMPQATALKLWESFTDVQPDGGTSTGGRHFGGGESCTQCSFLENQYSTYLVKIRDRNPGGSFTTAHWDFSSASQYTLKMTVDDTSGCPGNCSFLMEAGISQACGCYCANDRNACAMTQ